jgi:hypothetical protein
MSCVHYDIERERAHYRGYWNDMWFRIALRRHIADAREQLQLEIVEQPGLLSDDYEELAREVAYECAPAHDHAILAIADLCPRVWEKADELDYSWGPGTEYQALRWAIGYLIFEEILYLVPE